MTTMSDDGERMCPLCAEEMDLTDQQLKPCKCGYEICVWCWHHIIDMAEKEDTEGRCPACRTTYNKERIVGTAASCEKVVAEMNVEKRAKPQKAKPKSSTEARKQLSSVRVIQRNLVYIIGLPFNLCDENLLERKEYFGQYGKVLKVSISRTTTSIGQQASNNNTFSVYITYAREEEAVRCIQAVHNFVLEGKPLRACFGTTKYCHAWLRNLTCSNPDCLYLHDIGDQEDSFTKDEIITAYTRSRIPQIAAISSQRRGGNVLPPPVDDMGNSGAVSGKHIVKCASNNATSQVKVPPNYCNAGKATVLPAAAAWGLRVSNSREPAVSMACSQSVIRQNVEAPNSLSSMKLNSTWDDDVVPTSKVSEGKHALYGDARSKSIETMKSFTGKDCRLVVSGSLSESPVDVAHTPETSAWDDDEVTTLKALDGNHAIAVGGRLRPLELVGPSVGRTSVSDVSPDTVLDASSTSEISVSCSTSHIDPAISENFRGMPVSMNKTHLLKSVNRDGPDQQSNASNYVSVPHEHTDVNRNGQALGSSIVNLDNHLEVDHWKLDQHPSSLSNHSSVSTLQPGIESLALLPRTSSVTDRDALVELHDWDLAVQKQGLQSTTGNEMENKIIPSDEQIQRFPDVSTQPLWSAYSCELPSIANSSSTGSWSSGCRSTSPLFNEDSRFFGMEANKGLFLGGQNNSVLPNGHVEDKLSFPSGSEKISECSSINYSKEKAKCVDIFDSVANFNKSAGADTGDCNIISDIPSLDFDPWDDSLCAANNFARLLGESSKLDGVGSWKPQTNNESRFSFARQERQENVLDSSVRDIGHAQNLYSSLQNSYVDGFQNGSLFHNFGGSPGNSNTFATSDRTHGVSKAKMSVPPGFSLPNRAPPPGFSSQDRYDQAFGTPSEKHLIGNSTLRNQQQTHLTENTGDVEFIDPAILAVGKGKLPFGVNSSGFSLTSAFPAQFNSFENDWRLQLLMQQSNAPQDLRFTDHLRDGLSPFSESYISSRLLAENSGNLSPFAQLSFQHPRNVPISSSHWDGWNDVRTSSDVGMAENFRSERFGLNNYFPGNEEHKFRMPSPGDVYNRAFGM